VMRRLGASQKQASHALTCLLSEGRVVKVMLGNVSIWCRDKKTAEEYVKQLKAEVVRLTADRRYISPRDLLSLILFDKSARKMFRRIALIDRPSILTYGTISALLQAVYGEPIRGWKYHTLQPNLSVNVEIIDHAECGWRNRYMRNLTLVTFKVPRGMLLDLDDYAKQMRMTRSDVVRTAIRNLLEEFNASTGVQLLLAPNQDRKNLNIETSISGDEV